MGPSNPIPAKKSPNSGLCSCFLRVEIICILSQIHAIFVHRNDNEEALSTLGNGHRCVPLEKLTVIRVLGVDQNQNVLKTFT